MQRIAVLQVAAELAHVARGLRDGLHVGGQGRSRRGEDGQQLHAEAEADGADEGVGCDEQQQLFMEAVSGAAAACPVGVWPCGRLRGGGAGCGRGAISSQPLSA
ncbi:hypothetical protein [Pseudorhodoferax sp. Leaf267]|uniref:hypothetical protein n=1 Tax=Pseudorhodoferax sp. Leaf267 TaxID=1736316 RepID=UPI0006FB153F|nr:hypothetical protein [Pseudorhodoferax sp. Leaf267]KQP18232.1 hypothetical protein ASF43_10405 [Pseudorhodoferax sp. Leaf267]